MAKVIIVDDSSVTRFILRKCLEKNGHEVVGEAINGQDTLRLYSELRPDVVLLDIHLPDDNGLRILEQLISYDKYANVIMCSSAALQNIIIEAHQLGAKHFLVKPFTGKLLEGTIQKTLKTQKNLQYCLI
ncbi:MAG: response regulator [Candidatus Gastranaerophilales bacterium]|nr:response regulator [Candidatus Gastranaerophilales bacterium]